MKKILLSLALVASVSLGLSAQQKEGGRRGGERAKGLKELNLTAEQQAKMKVLSEDFKSKSESLRSQQTDLRKNHQAGVMAILTPEQQAKWQARVDKRAKTENRSKNENRAGKHSGRKGKGGKKMNLDAATTAKLDDLKSNFVKEKKAVELSRIAPEAQKEKIQGLKEQYRKDRREVIKKARPQKAEKLNS